MNRDKSLYIRSILSSLLELLEDDSEDNVPVFIALLGTAAGRVLYGSKLFESVELKKLLYQSIDNGYREANKVLNTPDKSKFASNESNIAFGTDVEFWKTEFGYRVISAIDKELKDLDAQLPGMVKDDT